MEHVEIDLLGGFEVRVDGRPLPAAAWAHGRARDLVKLLALAPSHRLPRDRVLDELWPQLGPKAAVANLHKAAHHGRRAVGEGGAVVLRTGQVMLAPDARVETDVERFEASWDPELYRGELLPDDPYATWVQEKRAVLRARYLDALRHHGRWEELADEEPADEPAQRAVMRARLAAGDRAGALGAFERLSAALEPLGLRPSVETIALHARIAGGTAFDKALAEVEQELAEAPLAERAQLLATRADLLMAIGDRGAPAAYAEAAAAAGLEGMALRIRQAWAQLAGGDPSAAQVTLQPLAPSSDEERAAHLLVHAAAAWYRGDVEEARRAAGEAEPITLAAGLTRQARTAVQLQAMVAHSSGRWPVVLERGLDESLRSPDLADTLFDGHLCVAEYALTSGEPLERIRSVADELHAGAVRTGARRAQAFAATVLGEVALASARVDEAETRLREAVRLSRGISALSAEALATVRLGEALHARGDASAGETMIEEALVIARWAPLSGHLQPLARAALLRTRLEPDACRECLDEAEAYLRNEDTSCAYCGMAFRVAAAISAARAGDLERAEAYVAAAEATATLWKAGPWPAALEEARGELAWARGDELDARARLGAAHDAFAREGRRLDAERLARRLGVLG